MDKILVGYDGSERGNDALHLADALRTVYGAEMLVAVVDEVDPIFKDFPPYSDQLAAYYEESMEGARKELAGAVFEERTASGSPARALDEIASDEGVDLIVVGSTHRGRVGRILPGSVGSRLLQGAPCAVGIAPVGYATRRRPPTSAVGVGYDGGPESLAALKAAEDLARRLGAELRVIGVAGPVIVPGPPAPSGSGYEEHLHAHVKEILREGMGVLAGDVRAESVLIDGNPAGELTAAAADFDLLLLGSRGYGPVRRVLLGGVAARVVEDAACPVIVLPRHRLDSEGE